MLLIEEIEKQYPEHLRVYKTFLLKEYLQYKILEIIFASNYAQKLVFLSGTALRIIYNNQRFSEDLDFDNLGLKNADLQTLTKVIQTNLEKEGYEVEISHKTTNAFRCKIRFPGLLSKNKLALHEDQKILIQFDTEPQHFDYVPEKKIINKFDVFCNINVTPIDILLSQKIFTAFNRKQPKGRDFFDIIFLSGQTKPNYQYLEQNLQITNTQELSLYFKKQTKKIDFKQIAKDVEPFLFYPKDVKKILMFPDWVGQEYL